MIKSRHLISVILQMKSIGFRHELNLHDTAEDFSRKAILKALWGPDIKTVDSNRRKFLWKSIVDKCFVSNATQCNVTNKFYLLTRASVNYYHLLERIPRSGRVIVVRSVQVNWNRFGEWRCWLRRDAEETQADAHNCDRWRFSVDGFNRACVRERTASTFIRTEPVETVLAQTTPETSRIPTSREPIKKPLAAGLPSYPSRQWTTANAENNISKVTYSVPSFYIVAEEVHIDGGLTNGFRFNGVGWGWLVHHRKPGALPMSRELINYPYADVDPDANPDANLDTDPAHPGFAYLH